NVRNFVPLALDLLLSDLASAGYEAGAVILPACAVGAPHIRERCFIVAHTQRVFSHARDGSTMQRGWQGKTQQTGVGNANALSNPGSIQQWIQQEHESRGKSATVLEDDGPQEPLEYANRQRQQECNIAPRGNESRFVARRPHTEWEQGESQSSVGRGF